MNPAGVAKIRSVLEAAVGPAYTVAIKVKPMFDPAVVGEYAGGIFARFKLRQGREDDDERAPGFRAGTLETLKIYCPVALAMCRRVAHIPHHMDRLFKCALTVRHALDTRACLEDYLTNPQAQPLLDYLDETGGGIRIEWRVTNPSSDPDVVQREVTALSLALVADLAFVGVSYPRVCQSLSTAMWRAGDQAFLGNRSHLLSRSREFQDHVYHWFALIGYCPHRMSTSVGRTDRGFKEGRFSSAKGLKGLRYPVPTLPSPELCGGDGADGAAGQQEKSQEAAPASEYERFYRDLSGASALLILGFATTVVRKSETRRYHAVRSGARGGRAPGGCSTKESLGRALLSMTEAERAELKLGDNVVAGKFRDAYRRRVEFWASVMRRECCNWGNEDVVASLNQRFGVGFGCTELADPDATELEAPKDVRGGRRPNPNYVSGEPASEYVFAEGEGEAEVAESEGEEEDVDVGGPGVGVVVVVVAEEGGGGASESESASESEREDDEDDESYCG